MRLKKITALLLSLFFAVFKLPGEPADAWAASKKVLFSSREHGITLSYSSDLLPQKRDIEGVLLFLKHKSGRYPTINLILSGGSFDINRPLKILGSRLLDDYRLAGIASPELKEARIISIDGGIHTLRARINYRLAQNTLSALVAIIPLKDSHLVLTMITEKANFSETRHYFDEILNSLKIDAKYLAAQSPRHRPDNSDYIYILALLVTVALAGVGIYLLRCRDQS